MNETTFLIDTDDIQKPLLPNSGGMSTTMLFRMVMYYTYIVLFWYTYIYLVIAISKYNPFISYWVNICFQSFISIFYVNRGMSLNKKIKQAVLEDE